MGHNIRFRTLYDAAHYRADFAIICRACGREVVIERTTLIAIAQVWKLAIDRETLSARLRCTACRKRGCRLEYAPQGGVRTLRLAPGAPPPPRGVSITRWLTLSPDDQRALIEQRRRAARAAPTG